MFPSIGLGGILTFQAGQAIAEMGRTASSFNSLGTAATNAKQGVSKVSTSFEGARMMAQPLVTAVEGGIGTAAQFEQQMSTVAAVGDLDSASLEQLTALAKKMGIETVFSARESGQAMEFMARAGADAVQITAGLPGVLAAAAAEGIGLGTAGDIVSRVIKGMGLEWQDATHVANALALASARTNTSIVGLGEGMGYVAGQAHSMGFDLDQTVGALALLSDAGLQGSRAGTHLTHMFTKLSKPSTEGANIMARWGIALTDTSGKMLPISRIVQQFAQHIDKVKSATERARLVTEVFGIQGAAAYNALATAGKKKLDDLTNDLRTNTDAAEKMAERRLNNLLGQVHMLGSSLQGLSIEIFGPMLEPITYFVRIAIGELNDLLYAIQAIKKGMSKEDIEGQFGTTTAAIAYGVMHAVDAIVTGFDRVRTIVYGAIAWFQDLDTGTLSTWTSWILVAAILSPIIAAVGTGVAALAFLATSVLIPAIEGTIAVFSTLLSILVGPVGLALGAIAGIIYLIKDENESYGAAALRVWGMITSAVLNFYETAILPLWAGISEGLGTILPDLAQTWTETLDVLKFAFNDIIQNMLGGGANVKTDWREIGHTIAAVIGAAAQVAMWMIRELAMGAAGAAQVLRFLGDLLHSAIKRSTDVAKLAVEAFRDMSSGNILMGIAKLGDALLDSVLQPMKLIIDAAIKLADAVNLPVPDFLREFVATGVKPVPRPKEGEGAAAGAAAASTGAKAEAAQPPTLEATVEFKDASEITVKACTHIDGREVAFSQSKIQQQIQDRSGFKSTPWQRRILAEQGAVPILGVA